LGIEAERISCLYKVNNTSQAKILYKKYVQQIEKVKNSSIDHATKGFVSEIQKCVRADEEALWAASRLITY
jgi:hypothetical protein